MKNFTTPFLAGILGSVAAIGVALAAPAPADAGTCWFRDHANHVADAEWCATNRRINSNGHVVFDVTDDRNRTLTIVMWDDDKAELIGVAPNPVVVPFYTDSDGDQRFVLPRGAEFIVRF